MTLESLWSVLADAGVKSAMLLVLVVLVTRLLLFRSSAARRHLVWVAALALCLLMPALALMLPAWRVLPALAAPTLQISASGMPDQSLLPQTIPTGSAAPVGDASAPSYTTPAVSPAPIARRAEWTKYLLVTWLVGIGVVLLPTLMSRLFVWRLCRHASPADHLHPTPAALLTSSSCRMPMATGILRPAIVLPHDALQWEYARLKSVVDHEAAHVRRFDCLWQTLGQVTRALYWPNPLVWMAYRQLLCEGERACDDDVIARGSAASDYAEHLLSIATSGRSDTILAAAAIAMARPTTLEGRLMSILDHTRNRSRVTTMAAAMIIALTAAVAVPLSMVHTALAADKDPGANAATAQPADSGAQGATVIRLKLQPKEGRPEVQTFSLPENATPQITWEDAPDAKSPLSYQAVTVSSSPQADLKKIPNRQIWEMMNRPDKWAWEIMNLPPDVHAVTYGQKWPAGTQVLEWKTAQPLKAGYYALWIFGYRGEFKKGADRDPYVWATAMLKVGNPPEPAQLDVSKLTPEVMTPKLKEYVEGFFASNYRDITARKTIEWGEPVKEADGNWSIRYKYEATIWDKDKIVQDKVFTFTPEGGFVNVKDAGKPATQRAVTAADRSKADELAKEGWALWQKHDFGAAADRFEESVTLNPAAANAWNGYGWALLNGGRAEEAKDAFAKCIELSPKHPAGLNGLGQVELALGDLQAAEKHLLAASGTAPASWWGLTRLYLIQGKYDQAQKWADRIVKSDPQNEEAKALKKAAAEKRTPEELKLPQP